MKTRPADYLNTVQLLNQLAEEAGELASAANKMIRIIDGAAEVSIYLHPDFRGQHIGSQLMQKILAFAAQQPDIDTVISLITSENTVSIHLHEKFGFTLCGVIHRCGKKFGRYLDLSIYQILFLFMHLAQISARFFR